MKAALLAIAVVACREQPHAGGACPALRVTADGVALPAMTTALAFSYRVNDVVTWHVDLSDRAQTCEHYLGKDGRILQDGEHNVSASTGGLRAVGIGNELVRHDNVELVEPAPSKPGDKLTLCVTGAAFTSGSDSHKGQKIVMDGRFEGTYCGEQKR